VPALSCARSVRPSTPEGFENGGFALKTHQMFPAHITPEEIKNTTTTEHFRCEFEEISSREITLFSLSVIVFEKLRFQNAFSNSSRMKSVFKKFRFRDGLALGLTVELQ